jgi:hypothetical protein
LVAVLTRCQRYFDEQAREQNFVVGRHPWTS